MILAWLATLWLALLVAGNTPTGRAMRRIVVEAPARTLARIQRGQWLMLLALIVFAAALAWLTEGEGVQMLAFGGPELMGMLASVELGTLVDVLAVALVSASAMRLRTIATYVRGITAKRAARPRRSRSRVARVLPANDDEDRGSLRAAA